MPLNRDIRKVLMIGSGPIVIGQAAEFDYAGAQACRVLKAAGVNVVLVNSNPATIMTDSALADEIYLEPLTARTVKRIIEHVDFLEVKAGEKIDVEVPVFVEGTPKGAAVAFVDIQELKVRADVANLPEKIVVSVEGLTDGTKVFAKDVVLPEGVELDVEDPEESVVTVEVPEDASESTAAPEAAAPAADAAAPAADAK